MTLTFDLDLCCLQKNYCMTLTFAILLGIIFLMEIGAGIAAYHLKGQVHRKMSKLVDLFYKPAQKHPVQFIPE